MHVVEMDERSRLVAEVPVRACRHAHPCIHMLTTDMHAHHSNHHSAVRRLLQSLC